MTMAGECRTGVTWSTAVPATRVPRPHHQRRAPARRSPPPARRQLQPLPCRRSHQSRQRDRRWCRIHHRPDRGRSSISTRTLSSLSGHGTIATATVRVVTRIVVTTPGDGYLTPGIRKFVNTLPGLGNGTLHDQRTTSATTSRWRFPTPNLSRHGLLRDRAGAVSPPVLHRRPTDPVARIRPTGDACHHTIPHRGRHRQSC